MFFTGTLWSTRIFSQPENFQETLLISSRFPVRKNYSSRFPGVFDTLGKVKITFVEGWMSGIGSPRSTWKSAVNSQPITEINAQNYTLYYTVHQRACADFPNVANATFWGCAYRGLWHPNSNSAEIYVLCTYPQVSSSCVYSFGSYRVDKQTNRRRWKHPTFFATLRLVFACYLNHCVCTITTDDSFSTPHDNMHNNHATHHSSSEQALLTPWIKSKRLVTRLARLEVLGHLEVAHGKVEMRSQQKCFPLVGIFIAQRLFILQVVNYPLVVPHR